MLRSIPRPGAAQTRRILLAGLAGTTIEFFDFYIYGTAAALVFPRLFFPKGDAATALLQSFATFALAFFARPVGSALFGHFGDRIGRKATLVTALLTMGISTVAIGLLPTYASIGVPAAALLALCRLGQGVGLGGEWGGAVLLATENAPPVQSSMVWKLSAARRAHRIFMRHRRIPADGQYSDRGAALCVGMARALPRERRLGAGGAVRAPAACPETPAFSPQCGPG